MPAAMPTVNPLAVGFMLVLMGSMVGVWVWTILRFAFGKPVLPQFEPRLVPWGGKSALAVILAWVALQVGVQIAFVFIVRGTLVRPPGERIPLTPAQMMTASAIQNATVLAVIPLLLWVTCRARARDYGSLGRKGAWQFLQGMVAWPLAAPLIYAMMLAAVAVWGRDSHPLETAIQNEGVGGKAVIFFLAGAVFAPAAEELIFRGVLLGWLTSLILRPRLASPVEAVLVNEESPSQESLDPTATLHDDDGLAPEIPADDRPELFENAYAPPRAEINSRVRQTETGQQLEAFDSSPRLMGKLMVANVLVSILFAGLHYSVWPTPVPIFFLSLALGLLYQRTGSLVAPTALHMTFNGISTILMFLTIGMHPDPSKPPQVPIPAPVPKPVDPRVPPPVATIPSSLIGRSR